ncbi:MAG: NAD(P) transhydrogenase alpha subunit, partial [uncultured Solirubrobacteraceae bacterium]
AHREPRDPRPGRVRRLRGDLQGPQHPPHPAHVRDERDPRHRDPRGDHPAGPRRRGRHLLEGPAAHRGDLRDDQRRRRLPGHRPDARDVQGPPM